MIQMTLSQIAALLELPAPSSCANFQGISIDTRTLQAGNLFIAILGEHNDGHDFIDEAHQKGAAAAIVSREIQTALPQLMVKDTTAALGQIGKAWRQQFDVPFIAVTGSNGKTTLKNMIAAILTAACQGDSTQVLATQGTLNNHWGLPLTLVRLNSQHRYAVVEMGMNHFGEIDYLTQLTKPQVAVITNAAACHLEGVGDIAGVARAKAEIFNGLTENGTAVLNRDDEFFTYWHDRIANRRFITFGCHPEADVRATLLATAQTQSITLHTPQGDLPIQLPLLGKHNVLNALAAVAAVLPMGIGLEAIKIGLETIQPAPGRLQLHILNNGVNLIDDTYNANPFSLQAAVNTLANFAGKKILVLGDMKELGPEAIAIHQAMAMPIRQAGIDFLFTYGDLSANTSQAFGEGAYHFNEQEKLVNALKPFLYNQTTILIKGSRSMKMEKVISGLIGASL